VKYKIFITKSRGEGGGNVTSTTRILSDFFFTAKFKAYKLFLFVKIAKKYWRNATRMPPTEMIFQVT
jgi:hypothetical protein